MRLVEQLISISKRAYWNRSVTGLFQFSHQFPIEIARDEAPSCYHGPTRATLQMYASMNSWCIAPWYFIESWWRHQMENFSALLSICAGNSPVYGEFPTQRPVAWSFDVFFDLRLYKRLSKQSWGWLFETLSRPLWRHCNVFDIGAIQYSSRYFTQWCMREVTKDVL